MIRFLIVTTSSKLAFETVKKQAKLLQDLKVPIVGIVENMKMTNSKDIEEQTKKLGLKFLAEIPYDPKIESAIGNKTKLLATTFARKVKEIVEGNHF